MWRKSFFLVSFATLLVVLITGISAAQERTVALQKGQTLWGILSQEGCTTEQVAALWPLVAVDSGLDVQDDQQYPVGALIALKRDCEGAVKTENNSELRAENEGLKKEIVSLKTQLVEARSVARVQMSSSPPRPWWWRPVLVGGAAVIVLLLVVAFRRNASASKKLVEKVASLQEELEEAQRDRVREALKLIKEKEAYPELFQLEHEGRVSPFVRQTDPSQHKVWFECPYCGAKVANEDGGKKHLKGCEKYRQSGPMAIARPDPLFLSETDGLGQKRAM